MSNTQQNKPKDMIIFKSVSTVEKYNFFEYLSVMVDSGVTISDALDSVLARIKNPFFEEKIQELKIYINSWDSFSKSMRKVPQVFNIGEVSIIEAWETTGMLVESLQKLSDDLKKTYDLKKKVKWSLTYPVIIFLFLILAIVIVLAYVLPSLTPLFETSWIALPWATLALIASSDFLIANYWYIIFTIFAFVVAFIWYKSTPDWRNNINNMLLATPLIWPVFQNYVLSNISASIWTLVGSGVNIIKALRLTWKSTWSSLYESLFDEIIINVSNGKKIVESMEEVDPEGRYFPQDFLQMLSVWERTAKIEEISEKINVQYWREVDYSLENLTKWIEPIAILLAASFVLWFAFAIFGAILKVTQTVN